MASLTVSKQTALVEILLESPFSKSPKNESMELFNNKRVFACRRIEMPKADVLFNVGADAERPSA
jgi:hypothetical protein